jgi:CDP-glucose 4,6-dehydratase
MNPEFWRDRRVLVTGHTGFKGGWLCHWLAMLGAKVHGFALAPPTEPNLYTIARGRSTVVGEFIADIRDPDALAHAFAASRPEIVLHLAAQPLVRNSYALPVETYTTNVLGTVHLLEAVRQNDSVRVVINVTTDKCYENREWARAYKESDALGGRDPYSSSKACSELVTAAYRDSFLSGAGVAVATARAGNVIGGGDFAADRLVPDFLRALDSGSVLRIRSPRATRPWQHVLEPVSGYLVLAERLHAEPSAFAEAFNFGPPDDDSREVGWLVERLAAGSPGARWEIDGTPQPHESQALRLDSSIARSRLGWQPRWHVDDALERTLFWHRAWRRGSDMYAVTRQQIVDYMDGKP